MYRLGFFLLVEHFLAHCRKILHSKQSDMQDMADNPIKQEQWQLELAWGQSLGTQILLRLKQRGEVPTAPGEESSNVPY